MERFWHVTEYLVRVEGIQTGLGPPSSYVARCERLGSCRAVKLGKVLLADRSYATSLQLLNLFAIGCLQRAEH